MNAFLSGLLADVDAKAAAALARTKRALAAFWSGQRDKTVAMYGIQAVKFLEGWVVDTHSSEGCLALKKALPLILKAFNDEGKNAAEHEISLAFERQNEAEVMAIRADRDGAQSFLNWYEHAADAEMYVLARPQYIRTCLALGLEI